MSMRGDLMERAALLGERYALENFQEVTLVPTEEDIDRLLEYISAGPEADPPDMASIQLCGRPIQWDLRLLRSDQLEALEVASMRRH